VRYLKDPDTGKRPSRLNPESEWVIQEVPEKRIGDREVWDAVNGGVRSTCSDYGTTTRIPRARAF
jgi:hypothetical protein